MNFYFNFPNQLLELIKVVNHYSEHLLPILT